MEVVKLETESYLFENEDGVFRSIPFYELSIHEWVIYENGQPCYFLDLNRKELLLIQEIQMKMIQGQKLHDIIEELGRMKGKEWSIHHSVNAPIVEDSHQKEVISLWLLDDLSGVQ